MSKLSWHEIKRCVDCDAAIEPAEERCGDCDRIYQRTRPGAHCPGPTMVQRMAMFEMLDKAASEVVERADGLGIPGVDALLVEWYGRRFGANSDDLFMYAPGVAREENK